MPGTMKMKTGSSFRKAAKIVPRRASRLVRGAKRALDDVLVGAPVPEPDDRRAEEHAEPGIVAVEVPGHPAGLLHRRPGALHAGGHERLPQVEHLGPSTARSSPQPPSLLRPKTVSSSEPSDEHAVCTASV